MLNKIRWRAFLLVLVLGLLPRLAFAKLKVLSTINILESTVSAIACCDVESTSLMGEGIDPHMYRATARDLGKLKEADLIFAVGLHLEGRMLETLEQFAERGAQVKFLGDRLPKERLFTGDPHIWFDPSLWMLIGDEVAAELLKVRPQHKGKIQENLASWKKEIEAVIAVSKKGILDIPKERRILVTSHDAFQYFGRFFGVEVHAVQGISTNSEASLKHMDELRKLIISKKVPAIFIETSVSRIGVDRLVEVTKIKIGGELYSDSLGKKGSASGTYVGMLQHNISALIEALK